MKKRVDTRRHTEARASATKTETKVTTALESFRPEASLGLPPEGPREEGEDPLDFFAVEAAARTLETAFTNDAVAHDVGVALVAQRAASPSFHAGRLAAAIVIGVVGIHAGVVGIFNMTTSSSLDRTPLLIPSFDLAASGMTESRSVRPIRFDRESPEQDVAPLVTELVQVSPVQTVVERAPESLVTRTFAPDLAEPAPLRSSTPDSPPVPVAEPSVRQPESSTVEQSPSAVASAVGVSQLAKDSDVIEDVLARYRSAYNVLDSEAANAIWPTVDKKALSRAFDRLAAQKLEFNGCDIAVTGARASALCDGWARYTPKVGNKSPYVEPRHWKFNLRRVDAGWVIEEVDAR